MAATVKIWDPMVRIFHWSLVTSFAIAWISAEEWRDLHYWAGYAAGSLIAFRLVWGLVGPRYARFTQFVKSPATVSAYLRDIFNGRERRHLGHNPAGGLMIVALLFTMSAVGFTGWLSTIDTYWGVDWVEEVHEALASALLGLVALHVLGVIASSWRHGENLIRSMWTGRKSMPTSADVV